MKHIIYLLKETCRLFTGVPVVELMKMYLIYTYILLTFTFTVSCQNESNLKWD